MFIGISLVMPYNEFFFSNRSTFIGTGRVFAKSALLSFTVLRINRSSVYGSKMASASTSRNTGNKRTSSLAPSPRQNHKNRYEILSDLNDDTDDNDNTENFDSKFEEVKRKIPPLYIYEINDYIEFLNKITPMIVENFIVTDKNIFLNLNGLW